MVPWGNVETKFFAANQQGLGTNSNLLRNARWNLDLSCTGRVLGGCSDPICARSPALYSKSYQKRPIFKVVSKMPYIQSCIKNALQSKLYQKCPLFKVIKNAFYSNLYQKCSIFKVVSKTAYILSKRPTFYQRNWDTHYHFPIKTLLSKSYTGTNGTLRNRSQTMLCFGCTSRHTSQGFGCTPRHMRQEILCESRDLWLVRKQGQLGKHMWFPKWFL